MKNILILIALISVTSFFACNKEEVKDDFVPASQVVSIDNHDNTGVADFVVNTDKDILENDVLVLTNNSANAVSYHWDFGNGDTSTEAQPAYKYDMHGYHTIKLTITDVFGNTQEASHEILVLCVFGGLDHESAE